MLKNLKVYVVGGAVNYANWISDNLVNNVKDADLVLFTGGEDVYPGLYGEPVGKFTSFNRARDIEEKKYFEEAVELNKHILGICRGSQLVCVLSGGKLVQHQENRNYRHVIHIIDRAVQRLLPTSGFNITSTHHQAAYPYNLPQKYFRVLAVAGQESRYHLDGRGKELQLPMGEIEIAYYPLTKALGIQGHPESMSATGNDGITIACLKTMLEAFVLDKL